MQAPIVRAQTEWCFKGVGVPFRAEEKGAEYSQVDGGPPFITSAQTSTRFPHCSIQKKIAKCASPYAQPPQHHHHQMSNKQLLVERGL